MLTPALGLHHRIQARPGAAPLRAERPFGAELGLWVDLKGATGVTVGKMPLCEQNEGHVKMLSPQWKCEWGCGVLEGQMSSGSEENLVCNYLPPSLHSV